MSYKSLVVAADIDRSKLLLAQYNKRPTKAQNHFKKGAGVVAEGVKQVPTLLIAGKSPELIAPVAFVFKLLGDIGEKLIEIVGVGAIDKVQKFKLAKELKKGMKGLKGEALETAKQEAKQLQAERSAILKQKWEDGVYGNPYNLVNIGMKK